MTVPFAAVVTPDSIVFTAPSGKTTTISSDNAIFNDAKVIIKQIGALRAAGVQANDPEILNRVNQLVDLTMPAKAIIAQSDGRVAVRDGVVYWGDLALHSALTERILWGLAEGFNMSPYVAFLENMMKNPSKRAVDQLYTFVERNKMGITDDGFILAYKRVRGDFMDIYTGKFDNSPGRTVWMPRNMVNDDPEQTCSDGLHACSMSYLPSYGSSDGNTIVIVKIDPADVVSVPVDYNCAKMRICRYEVLSAYEGSDKDDLLGTKAVFNTSEFDRSDDSSEEGIGYLDRPFMVGDRVRCIDDTDLGQTDIVEGNIYIVDDITGDRIWIGMGQGIGRSYEAWRFELVEDDSDPDEDEDVADTADSRYEEHEAIVDDWDIDDDILGAIDESEKSVQDWVASLQVMDKLSPQPASIQDSGFIWGELGAEMVTDSVVEGLDASAIDEIDTPLPETTHASALAVEAPWTKEPVIQIPTVEPVVNIIPSRSGLVFNPLTGTFRSV